MSEKGYGKRSYVYDYRITNRGGKGVKTLSITEKTGPLIAIKLVNDENDLMIINKSGIVIRMNCKYDAEKSQGIRIMGRAAQGVKLIDLTKKNDSIASVCKVLTEREEEEIEIEATEQSDDNGIETASTETPANVEPNQE